MDSRAGGGDQNARGGQAPSGFLAQAPIDQGLPLGPWQSLSFCLIIAALGSALAQETARARKCL